MAVEALATSHLSAQQYSKNIEEMGAALEEATDRLCDAENELQRQRERVAQCGEELRDLAGTDALADMQLELSFQRLIQVPSL